MRNNRQTNATLRSALSALARLNGPESEDVIARPTRTTPSASAERPGAEIIRVLIADPTKADEFLSARIDFQGEEDTVAVYGLICCNVLKHRGDDRLKSLDYRGARRYYLDAIAVMVGKDFKVPLVMTAAGMRSKAYRLFTPWQRTDMMGCCNSLAQCMIQLENLEEALQWLDEVNILYKHCYYTSPTPLFDWKDYNFDLTEFFVQRITAFAQQSKIFMKLGNTAIAVHRRWIGSVAINSMPDYLDKTDVRRIIDAKNTIQFTKLRHPDPSLVAKAGFHDSALQIRGSWKKLSHSKLGGYPGSRLGFACMVWNGCVYIAGGIKSDLLLGSYYRDMWCSDLQKLDGWRELPSYPIPQTTTGLFFGWTMATHNNKAYMFNGRPKLDFFDLVNEQWGSLKTKMKAGEDKWPYDGNQLTDYVMHSINGKLFIFGGIHARAQLGCNILMMLDLETLQWERLSGTSQPTPDYSCPGPRRHHMSWVNKKQDRIYIMYGVADRAGAKVAQELHAASEAYVFEDMWSWSIEGKKWRRERIIGNPPSPRSEMANVYNPKLDKMIVFGGYSPSVGTYYPEAGKNFTFSYYADTFLFDASTSKWKQVVTRGFPTYRAQARLFADPTTGKTFLFGGYTNADYVTSRKNTISRSFGDLWQLCIDEPGGFFEGVDYEEEARTATAGPWQRCFTCGCVGQCQKCGGTCKGSAFFCDSLCLKEGWKEHKERHNCRKLS